MKMNLNKLLKNIASKKAFKLNIKQEHGYIQPKGS